MKNEGVMTIDLGSAFAKIAVRKNWDHTAGILDGIPEAVDRQFLIPTTVAHMARSGKWLVGMEAAEQKSGPEVELYRYWKKELFSIESTSDLARLEPVVLAFFRALRSRISIAGGFGQYASFPIRICIPKLKGEAGARLALEKGARNAGFTFADPRPFVYEPASNVWGVITRGRNRTYVDSSRRDFEYVEEGRKPVLADMLDASGLLEGMRRRSGVHKVLVLDIGAYTTDVAMIVFDTEFADGWDNPVVKQSSLELGIADLDDLVFDALSDEAASLCRSLSPAEWDRRKIQLYRGDQIELPRTGKSNLRIGEGKDRAAIAGVTARFSAKVVGELSGFAARFDGTKPYATYLTGGGAMIAALRDAICDGTTGQALRVRNPVADIAVPPRTPAELAYANEVLRLARASSAIGGCSVFFG